MKRYTGRPHVDLYKSFTIRLRMVWPAHFMIAVTTPMTTNFRILVLALVPSLLPAANAYLQHNLVSDIPDMADRLDPSLVNPWGISTSATSPFWVADNGTGLSTLYNSAGVANALKVTIPAASGSGTGNPTGTVQNPTTVFTLDAGKPSAFLFATEDGTISGWNPAFDGTHAVIKVNNSASGAVYKGLAINTAASGPMLYASNFNSGKIDVFDGNFAKVTLPATAFTDASVPAGFAPFNIQNLGGKLYVTFARQDAAKHDDVSGPGNGYVDVFDLNGAMLQRLVGGGLLNSPWGLTIAPANFGDFSGALLVGNFGDGWINAYNPTSGAPLGTLKDTKGNIIAIRGLWALINGNGGNGGDLNAVYFAAGIQGEQHGLLGSIQAGPSISASNGVVNGASFENGIAQNTWISILGANLSSTTRIWGDSDFVGGKLPTALNGVSVMVNGKPAYVYFISPKQLNVLAPLDNTIGPVQIQTTNNGLTSSTSTATMQAVAPAFFLFNGDKYVAATHADGRSLVGPTNLFTPSASTPAKSGEVLVLYGTGFGPTTPAIPDGQILTTPGILTNPPVIRIGGVAAQVMFAGQTAPGVYQFNVKIPDGTLDGDTRVTADMGGLQSQSKAVIAIQN